MLKKSNPDETETFEHCSRPFLEQAKMKTAGDFEAVVAGLARTGWVGGGGGEKCRVDGDRM